VNVEGIVVELAAVAALAGLGWFFFGPRKSKSAELAGAVQRATVTVRGGYSPEVVRVRQGVPLELVFDRRESGDCTSRVVFGDLRSALRCRRTTGPQSCWIRPCPGSSGSRAG